MQHICERLQVTRRRIPEDPNINIRRRRHITYPRQIILQRPEVILSCARTSVKSTRKKLSLMIFAHFLLPACVKPVYGTYLSDTAVTVLPILHALRNELQSKFLRSQASKIRANRKSRKTAV